MKAKLDKNALAVANAVSKEKGRFDITYMRLGDGEIRACDGFMLARRRIEMEGEPVMVDPKELRAAGLRNKAISLETREDKILVKGQWSLLAEPKPDSVSGLKSLDLLYKELTKPLAYVAIGTPLLKKLRAVAGDASAIKFRLYSTKKDTPLAIEYIAGETYGLLMPYNMPEQDDLWYKPKVAPVIPTPFGNPALFQFTEPAYPAEFKEVTQ